MISVCDKSHRSIARESFGTSSVPPIFATTVRSSAALRPHDTSDAVRPEVTGCTTCFASMSSPASRSGVPK